MTEESSVPASQKMLRPTQNDNIAYFFFLQNRV